MKSKDVVLSHKGIILRDNLLEYIKGTISSDDIVCYDLRKYVKCNKDASKSIGVIYGYFSGKFYTDISNYQIRKLNLDVRVVKVIVKYLSTVN